MGSRMYAGALLCVYADTVLCTVYLFPAPETSIGSMGPGAPPGSMPTGTAVLQGTGCDRKLASSCHTGELSSLAAYR